MQGDWWLRGFPNKCKDRYDAFSNSSRAWEIPKTESGTSPKIVTLTVQPLADNSAVNQHCASRSRHLSMASTESLLAQRRRKLCFKNKTLQNNTRPVSMSGARESLEMQDLTWTNFFEKHFCTSSSNSPYAGQDLNASGSYSSCQQPAEASSKTQSTESYRALERRLEREREKRTHGEGSSSRLESKVLPEEPSPQAMDSRRNGFRLSTNPKSPTTTRSTGAAAEPSTASSGSFRTASNRDALSSMGSLTVASTPSSAALRGHSIGFGSRDVGVRSPTQRSRTRGGMVMPMTLNDKMKNTRYLFVDPVPSASPSFQQRLSELAALESDTIRYERTKRIKKRSKQENQ
ncbi:uncharacterized protein LOC119729189 isoform X2 [Patiria miniata]|uniref:Uncharacterized protein n=1 Tax=Patiria miniata TaxID=46514 RepID=A0A914A202_PATMI|nr:uncharacterized protein LOC119729189 isoform X2 [Patiria miniata]